MLRAVDELDYHCYVGDQTWEELAEMYDERQLIELLLLRGRLTAALVSRTASASDAVRGKTPTSQATVSSSSSHSLGRRRRSPNVGLR